MTAKDGLIHAVRFDGKGGGTPLDWAGVQSWKSADGVAWVHLDRQSKTTREWLTKESGLNPIVCEALLAEETRPRSFREGEGLLIIMRSVNMNPGANADDMISIRIWIEKDRIISLRSPKIAAVVDLVDQLRHETGPKTSGEFLVRLAGLLTDQLEPVLDNLEEIITPDEQNESEKDYSKSFRENLTFVRWQAITLRRYMAPQRDVFSLLQHETFAWLTDRERSYLREVADRASRFLEDLNVVLEHAAITRDDIEWDLSEDLNKRLYLISIVAGVFLPMGLFTGLLGINVGGMPGVDSEAAFWIVCGILVLLGVFQIILYRRMKWL